MQQFSHQGNTLGIETVGTGANSVVWLHGFCESSQIWHDLVASWPGMQHILMDHSGMGNSSWQHPHTIAGVAEAVHAALENRGIRQPVLLMGHSMGGYVAMAFAARYPEKVAGLGLIHSHPFADSEEKQQNRRKSMDFISRQGSGPFVRQLIPALFSPAFSENNPARLNAMITEASGYAPAAIMACQEAMASRPDLSEVMAGLQVPVLMVVGKSDQTIPYDRSVAQLSLPAVADIHILEGVAHMAMYEAPEALLAAVRNFSELCGLAAVNAHNPG